MRWWLVPLGLAVSIGLGWAQSVPLPSPPFIKGKNKFDYYPQIQVPRFVVGQTFVYLPDDQKVPPQATGPWRDLALDTLTLKTFDGHHATFAIRGNPQELGMATDGKPENWHGLRALVDDPQARHLNERYGGHKVWGFGSLDAEVGPLSAGTSSLHADGSTPWTIAWVVRIHPWQEEAAIGLPLSRSGGDRDSTYTLHDPLLVVFSATPGPASGVQTYEGSGGRPAVVGKEVRYYTVAGPWEFERLYSLQSPAAAHPDWSASTLKAIREGDVKTGMTHQMVAWILGYPSVYGTAAQVERLSEWPYDNSAPFNADVQFRGDRVVHYDPPRGLP